MAPSLASNITIFEDATYASLLAKLREPSLPSSEVRSLVAQLTTLLAQSTKLGVESTETLAVVVVLRSGLSMFEPLMATIPKIPTVTYHLGIFRDKHNLQPVEYYNKLPPKPVSVRKAVVIDPVIATGGTAAAVVNILKDWGIEEITFLSILASRGGAQRVADVWPESTKFILGAVDAEVDAKGYIQPGVGDIGDRLFGTDLK
ncbi:uracil phosphoribosyltransferase [Aspergillus clavatus NRRL 1]|uniref:uracil phosphoribosyltransferase n=1 Tax=Aspergillus clavatus (strain ATCC 1007 / CBS 513.65 / DSM 816 / NCTC 3887 / NRRL 1 / QM 1276 / 107) TaxID=344612 RepID=A1C4H5_ASPCL|nr:phosphoribosyl transferase, putative [Aspergillus clavatus NRRL 1]EAW15315.1 phosphoribosyl transferase, putative [Aspergillus clavatus NRRL 1]